MSFAHTFLYISHYKQIIVSILFPNEARLHVGSAGWYVTGTQTNTRAMEHLGLHIPHSMQLLHTILCEPHIVCTFLYILHAHNGMGNGTPNGLIVTIHTQREGQSSNCHQDSHRKIYDEMFRPSTDTCGIPCAGQHED